MKQKVDLEKEKKARIDSATEKDITLRRKINTIGNIVHDSVPISDNEVSNSFVEGYDELVSDSLRITILCNENGLQKVTKLKSAMFYHTMKFWHALMVMILNEA